MLGSPMPGFESEPATVLPEYIRFSLVLTQRTPAPLGTPPPTTPSPVKNTLRIPAAGAVLWLLVVSTIVSAASEASPVASRTAPAVAVAPKLAQPPPGFAGWPQGQAMVPPTPGKQTRSIGEPTRNRNQRTSSADVIAAMKRSEQRRVGKCCR